MRTTQLFFIVAAATAVHAADTSETTSAEYTPIYTFTPSQYSGVVSAESKMQSIATKNNIPSAIATALSSWDAEFWKTQTAIPTSGDTIYDAETERAYGEYAIKVAEAQVDFVQKNDKIDAEVQKSYVDAAQEYVGILKDVIAAKEDGAARIGGVGVLAGVLVSAVVAVAAL